ncbi:AraC family transcriptional regulator [Flavihumibacter fluvii]|uniref:AraC family transcriptional regulator n=1 Tax=Flavihumibacter fluvii TaxID=2838157 RepID=UPI001BDE0F31|nr:AraC family transcriptional regulator [Flavihumibacter fluvii]ULQ54739.1 AraC family transcriptional regulator [Flavihumibacter fluvii]
MKAKLEQLSHRGTSRSFICYEVIVPSFEFLWHYHPEYELTYILKGKGKRLVGDGYEDFGPGDLVLLPPMLPHTWISDKSNSEKCRAIVIQFSHEFVERLLQFSEMKNIEKLFVKSSRGLQFIMGKKSGLLSLLQRMHQCSELMSFTLLLQVLHELSIVKSLPIASVHFRPMKGNENQQRINKVFLYVQKEFRESISLKKAASIIHLSESAFCKYFKKASGKTFSDYTNDIRVAHACQLLIETDKPIGEIAFESGFESITYFNRIFLRKKKIRPGQYRKM